VAVAAGVQSGGAAELSRSHPVKVMVDGELGGVGLPAARKGGEAEVPGRVKRRARRVPPGRGA